MLMKSLLSEQHPYLLVLHVFVLKQQQSHVVDGCLCVRFLSVYCAAALISVLGNRKESKSSFIIANSEHVRSGYQLVRVPFCS